MIDLAAEHGVAGRRAQDKAAAAVRRSLAEGPELLAALIGRPFEAIVRSSCAAPGCPRPTAAAAPPRSSSASCRRPMMAGNLETALRRAACWAPRGMPNTAAGLLAGTEGGLRFRHEPGDLYAHLPSGEEVRVDLGTRRERVFITRTDGDFRVTGSADLPPHLVERAG